MANHYFCVNCGEFGPVFPKGTDYFSFCHKCFPNADIRVTTSGVVRYFRNSVDVTSETIHRIGRLKKG